MLNFKVSFLYFLEQLTIDVFKPQNDTSVIPIGSPVNLFCGTNSTTSITTVTWKTPTSDTCPVAVNNSGSLAIPAMQPSNVGLYTCTVSNGYESANKTFMIELPTSEGICVLNE